MRVRTYQIVFWPCFGAIVMFLLVGTGAMSNRDLASGMWLVGAAALWVLAWLYAISEGTWLHLGIRGALVSTVAVAVVP
jgi:hypothetical protein